MPRSISRYSILTLMACVVVRVVRGTFIRFVKFFENVAREIRFILILTVLVQLLRWIGTALVVLIPNTMGAQNLVGLLKVWDGQFYLKIALNGYLASGTMDQQLVNFAPLYPFLIWWLGNAFTLYAAPYILNTAVTSCMPFLAWKLAEKMVVPRDEKDVGEVEWRRQLIVLGICLNPLFLGYSIYNFTEPVFYFLLLCILNCNLRQGYAWGIMELCLLYFLGMERFIAVVICVLYAYQTIMRDLLHKKYKRSLRPLACIAVSSATYLLWDYVIPTALFGISASGATATYWGVVIGFPLSSPFFFFKIGIIVLAVIGALFILRMVVVREGWTLFGFRAKYLKELQQNGNSDSIEGEDTYNYPFIEALCLYGLAVLAAQGMMDPLYGFYRYVSVIIPFFACLSILTRRTGSLPHIMFIAIVATIISNVGVIAAELIFWLFPGLPRTVLPLTLQASLNPSPGFLAGFGLVTSAFVLFILYYKKLPGQEDEQKMPDMRKLTAFLAIGSIMLMLFNLYLA